MIDSYINNSEDFKLEEIIKVFLKSDVGRFLDKICYELRKQDKIFKKIKTEKLKKAVEEFFLENYDRYGITNREVFELLVNGNIDPLLEDKAMDHIYSLL